MDSFTENILARARERQRMLEGDKVAPLREANAAKSCSQPNLVAPKQHGRKEVVSEPALGSKFATELKENSIEGNCAKLARQASKTSITSEFPSSPRSQEKTLNIKNDNFNMEIKVTSADDVRVEVLVEEHEDIENHPGDTGLRRDAKNRLDRLGKLYAGGEDADISSPIHRTEGNFQIDDDPKPDLKPYSRKGLSKLADLAENINQWEDDVSRKNSASKSATPKKTWKPPAPQPPKSSPVKPSLKQHRAPDPPVHKIPEKPVLKKDHLKADDEQKATPKQIKWDKTVLDTLESQGFTRTTSHSKLVYKYHSQDKNKESVNSDRVIQEELKKIPVKIMKDQQQEIVKSTKVASRIADRAAIFESNQQSPKVATQTKDPALLSVSERKALFEKNKGNALVPKSPFAMAVPLKTDDVNNKVNTKSPAPKPPIKTDVTTSAAVPQAQGIASKMAALLESKSTISQEQIENNIKEQRRKEMDMLLNRFNKNREFNNDVIEEVSDSDDDTDEKTAMIPEKLPKIVASVPQPPPPPPPVNEKINCGKRCGTSVSPKVAAVLSDVKRIKVSHKEGRLYPSLSDIEGNTETETENDNETQSPTPPNSSFESSVAESDDVNTSFGRDILQVVCQNQTPQKRPILDDSTASDVSDILGDMDDDYIDEALAYDNSNGPTPPKQKKGAETSHSFNYKSFSPQGKLFEYQSPMKEIKSPNNNVSDNDPTYVVDGDNVLPLTHTVSFYRKQQIQASSTPVRQISRQPIHEESQEQQTKDNDKLIQQKIRELQDDVNRQEMIISQTSRALNLCNSTPEFMGSTEQVEAERVLLLATHRRQTALHELQRIKVEKCLRPQSQHCKNVPLEKGTLSISKICLPLKQKYVTALAAAGGKGHHVVCLIKCGEQVVSTPLVSTVATDHKNPDIELLIPGVIKLNDIYSDFTIRFEVYCLQAQEEILPHEVKYHINKKPNKATPKKSKQESRLVRPMNESPGGPQAVRSPTFASMGYVVFSVQAINKKHWTLNNTPPMSPLEGQVEMTIACELAVTVEYRGFLTMFEDVSGFGAWHRRWCLLKGHTLSYWKYPDDEKKIAPIDTITLKNCITKQVGPVSRDICARLHTFLIERERNAYPQDKNTLVMICNGNKTIIRHLLSADTKEERIEWCSKFNAALIALRLWGSN